MTRLSEILDHMTAVLNDLKKVMDAEQQQLSVGHINGSQLQRITEEKALYWRRWIIWSSSAVLNKMRSVTLMMMSPDAGRQLRKKRSIYAISTNIMVGCWKGRLNGIIRRSTC